MDKYNRMYKPLVFLNFPFAICKCNDKIDYLQKEEDLNKKCRCERNLPKNKEKEKK